MLFRKTWVLVFAVTLAGLPSAGANNANLFIEEILAGANGDSRVQFIVVRQGEAGENLWGPQPGEAWSRAMLVFYDSRGRETGKFRFPQDPATGGTLRTLLATAEFAALPGAPRPDLMIPPLVEAHAGKVCFRNNPRNDSATPKNECVAYGGDTDVPDLPITGTVSLYRPSPDATPRLRTPPAPGNIAGEAGGLTPASLAVQGEALFRHETFSGNGRICASCHVAKDGYGLIPTRVRDRAAAVSFDPLFISEMYDLQSDTGFDFNLNTMEISGEVDTPAPCTGELRGLLTAPGGGRARVLERTSPTTYLVYGGLEPAIRGRVTDGVCEAEVRRITPGDLDRIEDTAWLRGAPDPAFPQGRALILENVEGFENPPVFRRSPHLINLAYTAPYGFSGDIPDLRTFTTTVVGQNDVDRSNRPTAHQQAVSQDILAAAGDRCHIPTLKADAPLPKPIGFDMLAVHGPRLPVRNREEDRRPLRGTRRSLSRGPQRDACRLRLFGGCHRSPASARRVYRRLDPDSHSACRTPSVMRFSS